MSVKDISDIQVLRAVELYQSTKLEDREFPYVTLARETGQCEKVCYHALERASKRGYIESGVSLRTGWLTEKGKKLLEGV